MYNYKFNKNDLLNFYKWKLSMKGGKINYIKTLIMHSLLHKFELYNCFVRISMFDMNIHICYDYYKEFTIKH